MIIEYFIFNGTRHVLFKIDNACSVRITDDSGKKTVIEDSTMAATREYSIKKYMPKGDYWDMYFKQDWGFEPNAGE